MQPGTEQWLNQTVEAVIDPDRAIIDPHHHLWPESGVWRYGLDELQADTGSGHNIVATIFVECGAAYDRRSDDPLGPVGETRFVAEQAARSETSDDRPPIRGIVSTTDLRLPSGQLDEVLDAHAEAGGPLFRGIRHALARAPEPEAMTIAGRAPEGLAQDPAFRAGVARLGQRGLVYDSWHYHLQNAEFAELAAAVPDTTMVLDHFGTPIGVGSYADRPAEVYQQWRADIAAVAANENVVAKIGGLAMPDNGFGWHQRDTPASSDEIVAAHGRYYRDTIEAFGPDRCMFESNFPVDRLSLSYRTVWNAFKKMAAEFSADEQHQMFYGTAARVYGVNAD